MSPDDMESTLDAIRVFANSANSVRVFESLADGPTTGSALAEETGASRSTVARILKDGESREWIASEGSQYELTELGRVMIDEFSEYRTTVEGVQYLGEAIYWLPRRIRSVDYREFRDADVITPTDTNPSKPFDFVFERLLTADTVRSVVRTIPGRFRDSDLLERAASGEVDLELVIQASWLDSLPPEPDRITRWRNRAARNEVRTYDGDVPLSFHVCDDSVIVWLSEDHGNNRVIQGVLVSENPTVLSWARSLYDEYRGEAEPLDPSTLPDGA
jgi:predicted transcriptional regulator